MKKNHLGKVSMAAAAGLLLAAQLWGESTAGRPLVSQLSREAAAHFAKMGLACIGREFPNKPEHVINGPQEVLNPRTLHPSFFGCFDWHSSVHGHWLLVYLLRRFPDLDQAGLIRSRLDATLTPANLSLEAAYFGQPNRKSFERPYGWAWLLKLAQELNGWDDGDGRRWSQALKPLEKVIVDCYLDFFPRQTYPIRSGVHPNSAFALALAWDYARQLNQTELLKLIDERAKTYFLTDRSCPAAWEPGGEDFFSPCLMEADLMRRVLPAAKFSHWLEDFLPRRGGWQRLLQPAMVADRSDPKIVHLDGLNLSRAWCLADIAKALPAGSPQRREFMDAAGRLAEIAVAAVASGHYEGEHWLGTFAAYALSRLEKSEWRGANLPKP